MPRPNPPQAPPRSPGKKSVGKTPWKAASKPSTKFRSASEVAQPKAASKAPRKAATAAKPKKASATQQPKRRAPTAVPTAANESAAPTPQVQEETPAGGGAQLDVDVSRESLIAAGADEEYPDLAAGLLSDPIVTVRIGGARRLSAAALLAQSYADGLLEAIELVDASGAIVRTFIPTPPEPRPIQRRIRTEDRDWTVKPVVASAANVGIKPLLDRIEAARGNALKLRSFIGTFVGSTGNKEDLQRASTYYRLAGNYLWGLIREAEDRRRDDGIDGIDGVDNGHDLRSS